MTPENTVYVVFDDAQFAIKSFIELIQSGALPADVCVISRSTYSRGEDEHGRRFEDENRIMVFGDPFDDLRPHGLLPVPPPLESAEEFPDFPTPYGDIPLPDREVDEDPFVLPPEDFDLKGSLSEHLQGKGFSPNAADYFEEVVLEGGGIVSISLPSGNIDELQAWEIINHNSGREVGKYGYSPYLL